MTRVAAVVLLLLVAGAFHFLMERARRVRREAGFDEDVTPSVLRALTVGVVVGCFVLLATGSRWTPSRNVAIGLCLASVALSQAAMWTLTLRRGAPVPGAVFESGAMVAVIAAAFGAWLLL